MPKVARANGFVTNHGILAAVAVLAADVVQVLPLVLLRLSVKSTLPLLPAPGLVSVAVVLPALMVPTPDN